jgi:hypothetical protein
VSTFQHTEHNTTWVELERIERIERIDSSAPPRSRWRRSKPMCMGSRLSACRVVRLAERQHQTIGPRKEGAGLQDIEYLQIGQASGSQPAEVILCQGWWSPSQRNRGVDDALPTLVELERGAWFDAEAQQADAAAWPAVTCSRRRSTGPAHHPEGALR